MTITVSVITPVWNQSRLTQRWLYQNWAMYHAGPADIEWIIINNGSTDDTDVVLSEWKKKLGKQLKIVTLAENTGFGPANNLGAEIATGKTVAFISNDVQVLGDYITPLSVMSRYDQAMSLWGPELWDRDTGWNTFDQGTIAYLGGWCVVISRAYWRVLCEWDERFVPCDYEDIDLSHQATQNGGHLVKIDLPLKHDSGKTAQALPGGRLAVTLANRQRFMDKWGLKEL